MVTDYITGSYLSTWGSASMEGAVEGFSEGLRDAAKDSNRQRSGTTENVNLLPFSAEPYCRAYFGNRQDISRIVAEILPLLGNKILVSNEEVGVFATDYTERQHLMAGWRDSYEITVSSEGSTRTVVRVLRKLYISRSRGVFNQAISNGHNEAWIMTQIEQRLKAQGAGKELKVLDK